MRPKIVYLLLIIFLVVSQVVYFVFLSGYNKKAGVSAQGPEPELTCESPEIPVGTVTDATLLFSRQFYENLQAVVRATVSQQALVQVLLSLPDECKAENCESQCELAKDGASCEVSACAGEPCPRDKINAAFDGINSSYEDIKRAGKNIEDLFEKKFDQKINGVDPWKYCPDKTKNLLNLVDASLRDLILCLLDESRRGLSLCTTPESVDPLEEGRGVLTCLEANYFGALSEKQRKECYESNFFCCYFH